MKPGFNTLQFSGGAVNSNPASSIGGAMSSVALYSNSVAWESTGIAGITLVGGAGNVAGVGQLRYTYSSPDDEDFLSWKQPGQADFEVDHDVHAYVNEIVTLTSQDIETGGVTADANRFICTVHGSGGDFVVPMTFVSIRVSANLETETTQISINIPTEYAPLVVAEKGQLISVYQQLNYAGSTFNDLIGSAEITSVSAGTKLGSIRASKTAQPTGTFAQGVEIDQSKIIFETINQLRIPLRKDVRAGASIVLNGTAKEVTSTTTYINTTSALMEIMLR